MRKSIDFGKGERGKHSGMKLEILGASETGWAICIHKAATNIIQFKVYSIETFSHSSEIQVTNETGKKAFYPKQWFESLDVPEKTLDLLKHAA